MGSPSAWSQRFAPHLLAVAVLVLGLGITWSLWQTAQRDAEAELREDFDRRAHELVNALALRMSGSIQVLRGAQGLFAGSEDVTRSEFADYVAAQDLANQFPGMHGVGYMDFVRAPGLRKHVQRMRAEGIAGYAVRPAGEREIYTPVTYLEPQNAQNVRLFGYDGWSEPVRRAAFEQARDTALATMSGPVTLVQDDTPRPPSGVLVVLPVYTRGVPHATLEQRRAAITGFVYAPFRLGELFAGLGVEGDGELAVEAYDGERVDDAHRMYLGVGGEPHLRTVLASVQPISLGNRRWTIVIGALPAFMHHLRTDRAQGIALIGVPVTLVLTALMFLLARSRADARSALERARALTRELAQGQDRLATLAAAAQRSQAMLRSILDSTVDGILVDNGAHRILACNERFKELWSVPPDLKLDDDAALVEHMSSRLMHPAPFVYSRTLEVRDGDVQRELLRLHDGRFFEQVTRTVVLGSERARLWSFHDITGRKQVEQRERSHRHVLEMLARNAQLPAILDAVVLGVETANPGMLCAVALLERDGRRLRVASAPSLPGFFNEALDGLEAGHGAGSSGTCAASGLRVIAEEIATHPYWEGARATAQRAGLASCWSEPVRGAAGKLLGTFSIYQRAPAAPSPAHIVLLEQAAHLAGIAIEQAQSAQALRAGEERFRSLYDHAPVALWELDWSDLREACAVLRAQVRTADLGSWLRAHPDEVQRLAGLVKVVDLNSAARVQVGAGPHDGGRVTLAQVFDGQSLDSFVDAAVALTSGSLHFASEGGFVRLDGTVRHNQVTLLVMPGHPSLDFVIASTLDITERKRVDAELLALATTDFLTGLPNRREFMARLDDELARVQRNVNEHTAVLMLDLDHFKCVNDRYGHAAGDAVLRHLAGLMRGQQRKIDTLGRVGGEEFAVLLPGADPAAAGAYAERLRQKVADSPLLLDGEEIGVTVSIGIAQVLQADASADAALIRADQALYSAKAAGRNRVAGLPQAA